MRVVDVGSLHIGAGCPFIFIGGPCVIETEEMALRTASAMKQILTRMRVPFIFKASYDKANRSSIDSFRGPGLDRGLTVLRRIREELGVPVLSDVHSVEQVPAAADVLDVIQIPAFLCRQTDLLVAAGKTGRPVNLKKGQFMAPEDMAQAAKKVESTKNNAVFITERGTFFGYHNLVVDMRSLSIVRQSGYPVIFDATHSVQLPAAQGSASGGERQFVPLLARAAVAAGVDGIFMEVHPEPDRALCDGPNMWPLDRLESLLAQLIAIDAAARSEKMLDSKDE
jgi:2-dehydro-3-deoxyphosphooctonate aldolase (KDO 8-P synthase)